MTRNERYCAAGWALTLVGAALAVYFAPGCGPGESAARAGIRSAAAIVQALCSPTATVQECTEMLIERVDENLRVDGGGRVVK